MERIWNLLNWLRGRLWLLPALFSLGSVGLAYLVLWRGDAPFDEHSDTWWLYSGDAGTARDLLATLLSGMITMTSLVVSITIVVLSLAANQLGPRLIWNFIEDRRIQTVIGLFVATILYTLLVLRSIDDKLGAEGVPHVAVTVASVLTIACLFALLFHISLLARSIVSDTVVNQVAGALDGFIQQQQLSEDQPQEGEQAELDRYPHRCSASLSRGGYVQVVDYDALCRVAGQHDLLIVLKVRAGHFVLRGGQPLEIRSHQPMGDDVVDEIVRSVVIGSGRTATQDLEYSVRNLVEIALRALSPSLHDPNTAIAVIDRLAASLELAMTRSLPPRRHRDSDGRVRVISDVTDFKGLLDAAFNQIRQASTSNPAVLIGLARRLADLSRVAETADQRAAIMSHLEMIAREVRSISEPRDRDDLLAVVDTAKPARATDRSGVPTAAGWKS